MVAPLIKGELLPPDSTFALSVEFEGRTFTLALQQMSSIPIKRLGPMVGDLRAYDLVIARGWERLFTGF